MKKSLAIISVGGVITGLFLLAVIIVYTMQKDSGHTGADPYWGLAVFVPVVVVGTAHLLAACKFGAPAWAGVVAVLVGCVGITLLVYLDQNNTLLQYEVWVSRGMP